MKKILSFFTFYAFQSLLLTPSVFAQSTTVTLRCKLDNCSVADSLTLYTPTGLYQQKISSVKLNQNGEYLFQIPQSKNPTFYAIGMNLATDKLKYILVGTEKELLLNGPCYDLSLTTLPQSKTNMAFSDAQKKLNDAKLEMTKIGTAYNQHANGQLPEDIAARTLGEKQMLANDKRKLAILDSLKKVNPLAARVLALDTYTSFLNNPKKASFKNEIEYFATQYFQYVNGSDPAYNETAPIFDAYRAYASVILIPELKIKKEDIKKYFTANLSIFPPKSKAQKFALTGILSVLLEKQHSLGGDFGLQYLNDYPEDDANIRQSVSQTVNYMRANMTDVPAPEIAQPDTTGKIRKLSDLKGKVVLVDFWASWCGPCRRENPTVVAAYKKYQDKGFEVFSVSLDQDRTRWINAINQDGLFWPNHVSDLKQWQNEAAGRYGVSSIPRTVLIDREGNIAAHNLRGEALESKLKEIFGE